MSLTKPYGEDEQRFFQFNRIYVVETLLEPDTCTGKNLFQDLLKPSCYRHPWLNASYHLVTTKKRLFELLAEIKRDALGGYIFPWIHIEGHGNPKGLSVGRGADKTIIKWEDLGQELRKINIATKNNLMVAAATCHGSNLFKGIRVADRAPFFGFIAPIAEITEQEVEEGFLTFYERILRSEQIDEAMLDLRGARHGGKPRFTFLVAEIAFHHVGEKLLAEDRDPVERTRRLLETARMKQIQAALGLSFDELVEHTQGVLDNREQLIQGWFQQFVMKDLGSDNEREAEQKRNRQS
jgi:hypothetical protein